MKSSDIEERIQKGLERLQRVQVKEVDSKKQEEEKIEHEKNLKELSAEDLAKQVAIIKEIHPDDICPCCKIHIADTEYIYNSQNNTVICGACGNVFMPNSVMIDMREMIKKAKESGVMAPQDKKLIVPS